MHMRYYPSSLFKPALAVVFALGIGFAATPSSVLAKNLPQKGVPVLDFSLETLLNSKGKDPWKLEELDAPELHPAAEGQVPQDAVTIPRREAPFYLDVDRYRGLPVVTFPIAIAPGTNGLQPDLKLRIGGMISSEGKSSGARLTNPESIKACGAAGSYCLGDQKLVPVQGARAGTLFTLINDPRIQIHKSDAGFLLKDGNGLRQYYTAPSVATLETGPWEINAISDGFENFVLYHYDDESGRIETIYYGQDKADRNHLRKVHFTYQGGSVSTITTAVSDRVIRTYYVGKNRDGQISGLTECAPAASGKTVCYAPYGFSWAVSEDGKQALLSGINNGKSGETLIDYHNATGGPVISSLILKAKGQEMQQTRYHFSKAQMEGGARLGFGLSRSMPTGESVGHFTEFGEGKYGGIVVRDGAFRMTDKDRLDAPDLPFDSDVEYVFKDIGKGKEAPFLLQETRTRQYDQDGEAAETLTHRRDYDAKGRLKKVTTETGEDHFTYLDEIDKSQVGEDFGNLLARRTHIPHETKKPSTKSWSYTFDNGLLVKTEISAVESGEERKDLATTNSLDAHGNVIKVLQAGKVTSFTYDPEYGSFPISMESIQGKNKSIAQWRYDLATGQQLSEALPDGSTSETHLGDMGEILSNTSTHLDPNPLKSGEKAVVTVTDVTEVSVTEQGLTRKTVTGAITNKVTGETVRKTVSSYTDSLDRVVKMEAENIDQEGQRVSATSLATTYSKDAQKTVIIDELGIRQEIDYDASGQIIREVKDGYAERHYRYNDQGQVIESEKAGEIIRYSYDGQGRLEQKTLPGNRVFTYRYDPTFTSKIASVDLPSDKRIEFAYTASGQVAEKAVVIPYGAEEVLEFTTQFTYHRNQLKSVTYPDESEIKYSYDGSRLTAIHWVKEAPARWKNLEKPIVSYQPEIGKDRILRLTKALGNGVNETYRWGADGKLQDITSAKQQAGNKVVPFSKTAYEFGPSSSLLNREERTSWGRAGESKHSRSYIYDDENRVEAVADSIDGKAGDRASFKQFNVRPQIEATDPSNVNIQGQKVDIGYDKFGNINSRKIGGNVAEFVFDIESRLMKSAVTEDQITTITDFDYDHLGERLEKRNERGSVTHYIDRFYEFTIHSDGSMQATRYVWDHMGRVAAFTKTVEESEFAGLIPTQQQAGGSGGLFSFTDTLAQMSTAAVVTVSDLWFSDGLTTFRKLSPLLMIAIGATLLLLAFEKTAFRRKGYGFPEGRGSVAPGFAGVSSIVLAAFLVLLLAPTAKAALEAGDGTPKSGQIAYFHHDIRGSVIAISDEAGNQTAAAAYHPYGDLDKVQSVGNNNFRHKFAGLEYDTEAGVYNGGQRIYDPKIGKYLSTDPARATRDPYAYTEGDPVNYVDLTGRMYQPSPMAVVPQSDGERGEDDQGQVELEVRLDAPPVLEIIEDLGARSPDIARISISSDEDVERAEDGPVDLGWVRTPTFWNWTFGVREGAVVPNVPAPAPDRASAEDRAEYNRLARSGYMQGWTRTGGYLQSLLGAGLLAWWFPTSQTLNNGSTVVPGIMKDMLVYAFTVTAFSAYGKGYTANESAYWQGIADQGATSKDYLHMAVRRMFWKVAVQIVAFTAITFAARWIRGFPIFDEDSSGAKDNFAEIGFLVLKNLIFSIVGTAALLPYYLMGKAPNKTYDEEMTAAKLNAMPWWRRWTIKASIAYRRFNAAAGFWAEKFVSGSRYARLQALYYPLYVLQMYAWYMVGSAGYYGGYAAIFPALPGHDWSDYFKAWRRNLTLIILAPASSPYAYINAWHRRSFTLIKKRSARHPRTSGIWFRLLGPIEGLRLAKFNDASYLPEDEWMEKLRQHRDEDLLEDERDASVSGDEEMGELGRDEGSRPATPRISLSDDEEREEQRDDDREDALPGGIADPAIPQGQDPFQPREESQ
ncbi:MAG: RHS repeat-associated core domain-containing protein [Sneathiella sp.]